MIVPRYQQRTIYEGIYRTLIPDQKQLLWEQWLLKIDALLEDDALVALVQEALANARKHAPGAEVHARVAGSPARGSPSRCTTTAGGSAPRNPPPPRAAVGCRLSAWLPWPP